MCHVREHLHGRLGAGEARAEACVCTASGGVGKPLIPSLLSFYIFFVKIIMMKIMKHLYTFVSLSVSHYAQTHVFAPEFPGFFKRKRIVICKCQQLLGSLHGDGLWGSSVANPSEKREYL